MVDNSSGRKKSAFIAKTSVTSGAFLDFFVSSTNYKISYADFVSGLGVTGTITTLGAASGTPILNVSGTVNRIRNIENGSGITSNVSASEGCEIKHNFLADGTGHAIFKNTTAAQPTFASLVAGSGITLTTTSNYITIEKTADTLVGGMASLQGNSGATTIGGAGTAVLVTGTWTAEKTSTVTPSTAGRLTYTGGTSIDINFGATVSIKTASASGQTVSVYLARNGTKIDASRVTVVLDNTDKNVALTWVHTAATNDYFEIFVANDTTTDDLVVTNAVFKSS